MIISGRLLWGRFESLWGRAMPQIGKMRIGSLAGKVAFPPSHYSLWRLRRPSLNKLHIWAGLEKTQPCGFYCFFFVWVFCVFQFENVPSKIHTNS